MYLLFIFNCWYFWSFPIRFNFFFNEVVLNHNNYENLCMMVKRCKNKRDNDGTFIFSHSLSFHFSLLLQNCFLGLFQPILQTWCKVSNLFFFFRTKVHAQVEIILTKKNLYWLHFQNLSGNGQYGPISTNAVDKAREFKFVLFIGSSTY